MTNRVSARTSRIPGLEKLKQDPGFRKILEIDFNDMIPFVLANIRRRSVISFLYAGINLGMFVFIVVWIVLGLTGSFLSWSVIIKLSLTGIFAGSILLIPLHELLHGLVYWILGARQIRFGADMQQLIFFVTADKYPVSGKELYFLALTPFVVINTVTVVTVAYWFPQFIIFPACLLLSHNTMCIGDFSLVNYVLSRKSKVYTFDETEKKKSYFFEEIAR